MKRKIQLFLSKLLIICTVIFSLAACGGNAKNVGNDISSSNTNNKINVSSKDDIEVDSITLDKTNVTLEKGEAAYVYATIVPSNATNRSLTWSSSNTSVATVSSSGLITAISQGTATITVKTNNNRTANCQVIVTSATIKVDSITLDKTNVNLEKGESAYVYVTISPSNASNRSLTWSSSNTSVATVSSAGLITAISQGTATITVKTSNNKTATCLVTVIDKFEFEEYDTGYALKAYNGNESEVTVPSSYNGKQVVAIGAGKIENNKYIEDAFARNTKIKKVTLPNTIKKINSAAFVYCSSLEEIVIPSAKTIGAYAFYECTSLNKINLPANLENIDTQAFAYCKSLKRLVFPSKLKTINSSAFYGCSMLSDIKFNNSTVSIASGAFNGCNLKLDIAVPSTPLTFNNYGYSYIGSHYSTYIHTTVIINKIEVKLTLVSSTCNIGIYITADKTFDYYGTSHEVKFNYKVKNGDTVLASGTITSVSVAEGETFVAEEKYIDLNMSLLEVYNSIDNLSIELIEVRW